MIDILLGTVKLPGKQGEICFFPQIKNSRSRGICLFLRV